MAHVIGLPHVLAEVLALVGLGGGPMGLVWRPVRTRRDPGWPALVRSWSPPGATRIASLVDSLDDVDPRLIDARTTWPNPGRCSTSPAPATTPERTGSTGHSCRSSSTADPDALRHPGHLGGWITAVLRDDDGVRLLGM